MIVVDLGTLAVQQQVLARGEALDAGLLDSANLLLNALFYSLAGASVVRETGRIRLAVVAGLLAGLLDGIVVGAARAMTAGPVSAGTAGAETAQMLWLELVGWNLVLGTLLASTSAVMIHLLNRRAGGPR